MKIFTNTSFLLIIICFVYSNSYADNINYNYIDTVIPNTETRTGQILNGVDFSAKYEVMPNTHISASYFDLSGGGKRLRQTKLGIGYHKSFSEYGYGNLSVFVDLIQYSLLQYGITPPYYNGSAMAVDIGYRSLIGPDIYPIEFYGSILIVPEMQGALYELGFVFPLSKRTNIRMNLGHFFGIGIRVNL